MTNTYRETSFWLSEKEVSKITGLSTSTLQKQRFKGVGISYCKIGRSVRYSLADVKNFMNSHYIAIQRE